MSYHKHQSNGNNYTKKEIDLIVKSYKENVNNKNDWLENLAKILKRPKTNISRYARETGLTNRSRRQDDKICINCGKYFYTGQSNQKNCSEKCGDIIGSKKRTGIHLWENRPHPQGMLGKKHTSTYRKKISKRVKKAWMDKSSKYNSEENKKRQSINMSRLMIERIRNQPNSIYSRTTKGWREFGNGKRYFFRSKWEINYSYYLEWLKKMKKIQDWLYEVDTFWFEKIKRGVRSYTPDFKVINNDSTFEYHEVKGWMDGKSKTKLHRMKIYYPNIKIVLIDEDQYKSIKKFEKLFKWE